MPFTPKTPPDTPPGQLRQVLRGNVEDQMGIKGVFVLPEGAPVLIRQEYDIQIGVDEALAALFNLLAATLPTTVQGQLAALRGQVGV